MLRAWAIAFGAFGLLFSGSLSASILHGGKEIAIEGGEFVWRQGPLSEPTDQVVGALAYALHTVAILTGFGAVGLTILMRATRPTDTMMALIRRAKAEGQVAEIALWCGAAGGIAAVVLFLFRTVARLG